MTDNLQFEESIGYQIRQTARQLQRHLKNKIGPHGVAIGMWFFLRALWREDGLTQRELSSIVGTMEPTTLSAIKSMENAGLVERQRNSKDRRKINIFLTTRGKALENILMPRAVEVLDDALKGFSEEQTKLLFEMLSTIQTNLDQPAEDN